MSDNQFPEYDEEDAIRFIRNYLPAEENDLFTDDDLLQVIDALWDYYDSTGATSLDNITEEEDEYPEASVIAPKLLKVLAKKGPKAINEDNLTLIIKGEIAYEENLGSRM